MDERANLINKVTDKATKKAKSDKLNAAQTKLYVDEEVKKALAEYDKKMEQTVIPTTFTDTNVVETKAKNEEEKTIESKNEEEKTETNLIETKKVINKKYIVYTPVKNFCGEVAGVQFAYGKAEVKPGWVLNWFKEHGYKIEEVSN